VVWVRPYWVRPLASTGLYFGLNGPSDEAQIILASGQLVGGPERTGNIKIAAGERCVD
jgi:hypothetical protein